MASTEICVWQYRSNAGYFFIRFAIGDFLRNFENILLLYSNSITLHQYSTEKTDNNDRFFRGQRD